MAEVTAHGEQVLLPVLPNRPKQQSQKMLLTSEVLKLSQSLPFDRYLRLQKSQGFLSGEHRETLPPAVLEN